MGFVAPPVYSNLENFLKNNSEKLYIFFKRWSWMPFGFLLGNWMKQYKAWLISVLNNASSFVKSLLNYFFRFFRIFFWIFFLDFLGQKCQKSLRILENAHKILKGLNKTHILWETYVSNNWDAHRSELLETYFSHSYIKVIWWICYSCVRLKIYITF